MRLLSQTVRAVIASGATVLVLAACSPTTTPPHADGVDASSDSGGGAVSGAPMPAVRGALEEFLVRITGVTGDPTTAVTLEDAQARLDAEARRIEELVAACMAEQGFDYLPVDHAAVIMLEKAPEGLPAESSREFVERYGFAMVHRPGEDRVHHSGDLDHLRGGYDPNQTMVDAMSDAERAAWDEALHGPEVTTEGSEPEGCLPRAQATVQQPDPVDGGFTAIRDEVDLFWERFEIEPRIRELTAAWSSCMADAGHLGLADRPVMHARLTAELAQAHRSDELQAVFDSWDWEAFPDGPDPADLPQPDPAEIAAFAEHEIAVALADFDCRERVRYEGTRRQVSHELQQEFVNQHEAELEAWALHEEVRRAG